MHDEGYQVARGPGGTLRVHRPDGRPILAVPDAPMVPADPVGALTSRHRALRLVIDARTGCPSWRGERLDLGWAIDVARPASGEGHDQPLA